MKAEERLEISDWIAAATLEGATIPDLLKGFCERLLAREIPLFRANISQPTLHPIIEGYLFIWNRDTNQVEKEGWQRNPDVTPEDRDAIPFGYMWHHELPRLRVRLRDSDSETAFPLVNEFRRRGATDYYALRTRLGAGVRLGPADQILSSWVTDAAGGFTDEAIAALDALYPVLALAINRTATHRAFEGIIKTYLGDSAGRRVLEGRVRRGQGETIRAALWYCDLRGFTKISDSQPRDRLLAMMDDYFEIMVTAVHDFGGEILKFTGDGFLAMFSAGDSDRANCLSTLKAAAAMQRRCRAIRAARDAEGLPWADFGLGLHLGEVAFGNVGARQRLDFTVVGPAVNEVSRIEAMSRVLDQEIVVSEAHASAVRAVETDLVSLGRYALRGVRRPQELYTLLPDPASVEARESAVSRGAKSDA